MKYYLMITVVLLALIRVQAQNPAGTTLQWHVTTAFDIQQGSTETVRGKVIVNGSAIRWIDATGNEKLKVDIDASRGTWTNVQQAGQLVYQVHNSQGSGEITIWRAAAEYKIRIMLFPKTPDHSPTMVDLTADSVTGL